MGQVPFFEKSFGQPGVDIAFAVKQNPDSNLYVFGYSDNSLTQSVDFALSKLSPAGDLYWTKYYGTADIDFGLSLSLADSFDLILAGVIETTGPLGQEVLLIKVDSAGQELWRNTYGGPGNQSCKSVLKTSDGGYILCGYRSDPFGSNDSYVLKVDANGTFQWDSAYGGTDNEYAARIIEVPGPAFVMASDTRSAGSGGYDVMLNKLDSGGTELWNQVYGDAFQNGCQGVMRSTSDVLVTWGETEIFTNSPFDFFLYMFKQSGDFIRQSVFGGAGADALFDLVETPGGDFMATGYSNSQSSGTQPINLVLLRMDSLGTLQWSREYGDSSIDIGYSIIPALGGGYYVAGRITQADEEFYLLHVDENGLTGVQEPFEGIHYPMEIWPNPAAQVCQVRLGFFAEVWEIYDATGRLLFRESGPATTAKQLDISCFNKGFYRLRAYSEKQTASGKLMILR
ncbi:MAG: T9SS type A sorting domain-containing protein [Bacteroidia bacterium]|nr:T9SS type A sorting domain-containing protein [Bacteroidia bacterium]